MTLPLKKTDFVLFSSQWNLQYTSIENEELQESITIIKDTYRDIETRHYSAEMVAGV